MPTYAYRCTACGHEFERTQSMSEDALKECEVCGREVQRLLFAPAVHFKGTGFYSTDYGSKKRAKEAATNGSGAASTNGGSSGDGAGSGGSDAGSGDSGSAPKVKEATPAATAARATGP